MEERDHHMGQGQGQSLGGRAERTGVWSGEEEEASCRGKQNLELLSLFPKCGLFSLPLNL